MTFASTFKTTVGRIGRLSLGVVLGLGLYADIARAEPAAGAESAPALWVARDADSTVYLFGTVHVLRPETQWASPAVDAAFDSASELWMEIVDPSDQTGIVPLVQQHGISPDRPLSSLLNAEQQADLDAAARSIGATAAQLEPMRPWLAAITLSVAPLIKAGYDPNSGVELVLRARANEAGKPIKAFETADQQIRILAGLEEADQVAFLTSMLDTYEHAVTELDAMVEAWAAGDVETLEQVAVREMKAEAPGAYDALLTRRNADWAQQIDTLMDGSGTVFIAVGAAHLAGEDSVQALLAQRGIVVERVAD